MTLNKIDKLMIVFGIIGLFLFFVNWWIFQICFWLFSLYYWHRIGQRSKVNLREKDINKLWKFLLDQHEQQIQKTS